MTRMNDLILAAIIAASLSARCPAAISTTTTGLPPLTCSTVEADWLVTPVTQATTICRGPNLDEMVMTNGLISRTWRIQPNAATVAFDNLITRASLVRGVKPEAILELDGKSYDVGGLIGQEEYAYLRPEWLDAMKSNPKAFQFTGFETGDTQERFPWKRKRYSADLLWPAPGKSLALHFKAPADGPSDLTIVIHYEMYDGIPLLAKWFTIHNAGPKPVRLNSFVAEILAVVDYQSSVESNSLSENPMLHVESDYLFCGMSLSGASRTTRWCPTHSTRRR